jgi:3',5'-cyclic AMP phosphodiesterase CpdA
VSDLHLGRDPATGEAARRLRDALLRAGPDLVLATGDLTHRGASAELALYEAIFMPLLAAGRMIAVPGNHDRMTEDAAARLMPDGRVDARAAPGVHVVRLDSTAPHNRFLLSAHGALSPADVDAVDAALGVAAEGALRVLMLHHHLLPLPVDQLAERMSAWVRLPYARELALGAGLLDRLRGRCELVLHGHRHAASELVLGLGSGAPLRICNAGSTPELGAFRLFTHREGTLVSERWVDVAPARRAVLPARRGAADPDRARGPALGAPAA